MQACSQGTVAVLCFLASTAPQSRVQISLHFDASKATFDRRYPHGYLLQEAVETDYDSAFFISGLPRVARFVLHENNTKPSCSHAWQKCWKWILTALYLTLAKQVAVKQIYLCFSLP